MTTPWLKLAASYIGTKEIPGAQHNNLILGWWKWIRAPFTDDETPWCAAFVGGVLEQCNIRSSRSAAAKSYLGWGAQLKEPAVGAIVVFWRGKPNGPFGHVGFVAGRDKFGNIMVIGGNQNDAVTVKPFALSRVLSYRWPATIARPISGFKTLPLWESDGLVSTNEA